MLRFITKDRAPCTPSQIYFLIYPIPCPSQGVHFTSAHKRQSQIRPAMTGVAIFRDILRHRWFRPIS